MILDNHGMPVSTSDPGLEKFNFGDHGDLGIGHIGSFSRFLPFGNEGQELPQPLDFERLTDEFYRRNAVVYSAIRTISRSASEPEFQAVTVSNDGVQTPSAMNDPLSKLIMQPNEDQECYEFMEQLIIHLQVTGNGFIHKIRSRQGNVIHLDLIRPDVVSLIP